MRLLRAFGARTRAAVPALMPAPIVMALEVDGESVPILYKRHAAARRFTLRDGRDGKGFVMTMPKRARLEDALDFARRSEGWIRRALTKRQQRQTVEEGATITLRGISYRICATGRLRGQVVEDREARTLHVPGEPAHMARRLIDWLKAEAAHELDIASQKYAQQMGATFRKLSIRDQKSRWGSCSSDGALSYSWRLILAPPLVLDYVAAHEVAHLLQMNHGPRFWRLVLRHCPDTRTAQYWLKLHGEKLHTLSVKSR